IVVPEVNGVAVDADEGDGTGEKGFAEAFDQGMRAIEKGDEDGAVADVEHGVADGANPDVLVEGEDRHWENKCEAGEEERDGHGGNAAEDFGAEVMQIAEHDAEEKRVDADVGGPLVVMLGDGIREEKDAPGRAENGDEQGDPGDGGHGAG